MIDESRGQIEDKPREPGPTLIYVAGLAYSGTTLFASALGHSKSIVNGGEVNFIENDYHPGKICSCGEKVDLCTLWKPLLENISKEAASGKKVLRFSSDQYLRPIDRRSKPLWKKMLLLSGLPTEKIFGISEVKDYAFRHTGFLYALAEATNSSFVVDASKSFARLDALNKYSDLPIHIIFLKRSIIQSYASRLKRAKKRNKFYTPIFAPFYLLIIFATIIAIRRQLKRISTHKITFVDYETFVQNPKSVQTRLSKVLQTEVDFGIHNQVAQIGHLHIFTGNIWLSQALQKGTTVELRLGDSRLSLSWFEKLTYRLFSPVGNLLEQE